MAEITEDVVREALNSVEDPELMMGIVDLGLVYDVAIDGPKVKVTYTLTSMGCPVGPYIAELTGTHLVRLFLMIGVGAAAYVACELLLWWISGKPAGAEQTSLEFVARRLKGLRT